jgi:hypothetical protein
MSPKGVSYKKVRWWNMRYPYPVEGGTKFKNNEQRPCEFIRINKYQTGFVW